jgi:hypothetical protein
MLAEVQIGKQTPLHRWNRSRGTRLQRFPWILLDSLGELNIDSS